jgi:SAM-dependent methyltransferase
VATTIRSTSPLSIVGEAKRADQADAVAERAARLRFFLPRDLPKIGGPLAELALADALPKERAWRVLDVGAGLGTTSLGAAAFARGLALPPPRLEVLALEREPTLLDGMHGLVEALAAHPELGVPITLKSSAVDLEQGGLPSGTFDLIVMGLSLNELFEGAADAIERRAQLLERLASRLAEDGSLILVEPATPLFDEGTSRPRRSHGPLRRAGSMPVQYAGVSEEHKAVRTAAGRCSTRLAHGRDASSRANTGRGRRLPDHERREPPRRRQALYTCACNEHGTILDDLIVYRIDQIHWLVVCNASNRDKMAAHFRRASRRTTASSKTRDRTALLALQGPKAVEMVSAPAATAPALGPRARSASATRTLAGVKCTAARTGYTGEDGFEIFCAPSDAPALFRASRRGQTLRPRARGPRRPRHPAPRGAPLALRQRHRRDDQPHRGRARLGGEARQGD